METSVFEKLKLSLNYYYNWNENVVKNDNEIRTESFVSKNE